MSTDCDTPDGTGSDVAFGSTNMSFPDSDSFYIPAYFDHVILDLEQFAVPVICIFGLVGNSVVFFIFRHKSLQNHSYSLILRARSLSDNGFLVTLLTIWASAVFQLQLSLKTGICQAIIFFLDVFSCISVWLIVFVSFLLFKRTRRQTKLSSMGHVTNTRMSLILLVVCVVCCYNFPLWTLEEQCIPCSTHYDFVKVMVYTDSVITLFIPCVIVSASLFTSACVLYKRRRGPFRHSTETLEHMDTGQGQIQKLDGVTKMLLTICSLYYFTYLPYHIVHLRLVILTYEEGQLVLKTDAEFTIQSIAQLLYYLSFSINVVVFYTTFPEFRKLCQIMLHLRRADYRSQATQHLHLIQPKDWSNNVICKRDESSSKDRTDYIRESTV